MAYIPSADPSSSEELRNACRAETVRYTFSNILLFKTVIGDIKGGTQRVARSRFNCILVLHVRHRVSCHLFIYDIFHIKESTAMGLLL